MRSGERHRHARTDVSDDYTLPVAAKKIHGQPERRKHEDVASVSASRGVFKVKDLYVDLDYNVTNNPLLSLSCSSTAALLAFAAQTWRPPSDPLALRGGHACNSAGLCFVICAFFALSPRDGRTKSSFRKNVLHAFSAFVDAPTQL